MMFPKNLLLVVGLLIWSSQGVAQDLTLNNITSQDLEDVVSDFTGTYTHTSVSGANTLGSIFGFEVGVVFGLSQADKLETIVKREDATADVPPLPSGGLLGRLTVPFGITAEALIVPEIGTDDFKFQNTSAAVMWSPTETVLSFLPLSIAIKGHYTKTDLSFQIPDVGVAGVEVDTSFENTIMGAQLLVSKNLLVIEPYAGLGFVSGDGRLSYKGTSTIFDSSVTVGSEASKKVSGNQMLAGVNLKLLLFKIGAEYSKSLDVDRYALKFSAGF